MSAHEELERTLQSIRASLTYAQDVLDRMADDADNVEVLRPPDDYIAFEHRRAEHDAIVEAREGAA